MVPKTDIESGSNGDTDGKTVKGRKGAGKNNIIIT